jgi:hypothetical protein
MPNSNPTPGTSSSNTGNATPPAGSSSTDNTPVTKGHLRELYSHNERKSIPNSEQLVNYWLKDAERVAQSAGWNATEKIKYFTDHLRSDAADWHSEYMERAQDKDDYEKWEKSLIKRFLTETEVENLRKQLSELKQTADQSTQTFVSRIIQLYDIIHGQEIAIDFRTASNEAKAFAESLDKISEAKTKILLKGLLPKK